MFYYILTSNVFFECEYLLLNNKFPIVEAIFGNKRAVIIVIVENVLNLIALDDLLVDSRLKMIRYIK